MALVPHVGNAVGPYQLDTGQSMIVPASPERLAFIRVESVDPRRPLPTRIAESRWIVGDPEGSISTDDLQTEEVIPLQCGAQYPDIGRPYWIRDLTEEWVAPLRFRALALAELYGTPAATPRAAHQAVYRYADTSHPLFGEEMDPALLSAPNSVRMEGAVGLVMESGTWTFMEWVQQSDLANRKTEKHVGAGRDPRLLGSVDNSNVAILFREAVGSTTNDADPLSCRRRW